MNFEHSSCRCLVSFALRRIDSTADVQLSSKGVELVSYATVIENFTKGATLAKTELKVRIGIPFFQRHELRADHNLGRLMKLFFVLPAERKKQTT